MKFHKVAASPNFFQIEEQVSQYWKDNNTFQRSIETKSEDKPYRFYDGPPFITGLPHYGHILGSALKDMVTRFWTQKGHRIDRVWGWDCHGIYVEQKVQAKLWLNSNLEIEKYGIDKFIEACYEYTGEISDQWEWYVDHLGRWVDFKNAYKTMDNDYMESVMRVFKTLYEKNMVYKGKRVSLYSTKLNTPISNYEIALDNSYADISDPAITVKFRVKSGESERKGEFEYTEDGFLRASMGIIVKDGKILHLEDKKYGYWMFPGWKIDKWESAEVTILREIKEELWVDAVIKNKTSTIKTVYLGRLTQIEVFEIEISWEPTIQEPQEHTQMQYIWLQASENTLGFELNIQGTIIDDPQEIMTKFVDIYWYGLGLFGQTLSPTDSSLVKEQQIALKADAPVHFLAWTTTPWTIAANLALVVNADIDYSQIYDINTQEYYILAHNLISKYYKDQSQYILIYTCKGSDLVGLSYQPPFDYLQSSSSLIKEEDPQGGGFDFKVYAADYVLDTDGTGIVHTAPEFGEDDFQTGKKFGLTQTEVLDLEWKYNSIISDMAGVYYRDANDIVIDKLKASWLLLKKEQIVHSVAMCPRTNVPLIYKTQDSWFINIQSIKGKLVEHNQDINWVPWHLKDGRFAKSMESAPDWCISRTRYWATPMPVWAPENISSPLWKGGAEGGGIFDPSTIQVLGSREEIFQLDQTGSRKLIKQELDGKVIYIDVDTNKEFDLHRPFIDKIWGTVDGVKYVRIPEVLDPWLESGSMPYAQVHYPFENKAKFENSFPADYVAEYLGQVRCWFFFMHALGVMLFDSPAFTNVICTGVLAGNDGRKMSKSYGNYPDPKESMEKYGSDALRMYMANSPIVVGGDMNFSEEGWKEVLRKISLPLWNSYSFFSTYASIDSFEPSCHSLSDMLDYPLDNKLDQWLIARLTQLIAQVHDGFVAYDMVTASTPIYEFMNDLTNWYIRRSRRRFRKSENDTDKLQAYNTLYVTLVEVCKVIAPFMPFISEHIYRDLTGRESVHLDDWTEVE